MQHTLSASLIVDGLCAIISIVLLPRRLFNAAFTACSDSLSSAEVASSIRITGAHLRTARAMAILSRCPPDRRFPLSPTFVSYPSYRASINSCAFACMAALMISSSVASGFPIRMLSLTDALKRYGS